MSGAAAPRRRRGGKVRARLPRIGVALAGGSPLGSIYAIGALLPTRRRGVRQATRDLAHTVDHLEAWLAAASVT